MILDLLQKNKSKQFLRFVLTGILASAVHYAIYYVALKWTNANIAYSLGYAVSFVGNFYLTSYFTFHTSPTLNRFLGFAGSHAINYGVHIALLNIFLYLNIHPLIAPILVMGVAMIIQFTILRFVFTHKF